MVESPAGLHWRDDVRGSAARYAAFAGMVEAVFDMALEAPADPSIWSTVACFDAAGACVAGAEFGRLPLMLDGRTRAAGTIRLVGVIEAWRGRGLFRAVMERFLRWSEAQGFDLLLLYAAIPELYHRFGFRGVTEHAFVAPAPAPVAGRPARLLDLARDRALVERLLAARAPVSRDVAVVDAPELFLHALAGDNGLSLAHLPDADALIVFEAAEDEVLHLVDVVGAEVPSLPRILGALPRRFGRVRTLFPPDRLGWHGAPVAEDTGLMARGALPPAMERPFMMPPTVEF